MDKSVQKWALPSSYMGETWYGYYMSGFGRSRDSDTIEESNFQVASEQLLYLDRLYPKPDVAERDRLLRDLRIAIRHRADAADKMNLAAREYAYDQN